MIPLSLLLLIAGLWLFAYALGQTYQLFFAPLPGDEPVPAGYFRRHRGYIVRTAVYGFLLAAGYWLAAWLAWE